MIELTCAGYESEPLQSTTIMIIGEDWKEILLSDIPLHSLKTAGTPRKQQCFFKLFVLIFALNTRNPILFANLFDVLNIE